MSSQRVGRICYRIGQLLLVLVLLYLPLAYGGVRVVDRLVLAVVVLLVTLMMLLRFCLDAESRFHLSWSAVWVPVMLFYAWWRYSESEVEYTARMDVFHFLALALVFLLVANHAEEKSPAAMPVVAIAVIAALIGMYGGYQYLSGSPFVWGGSRPGQYGLRASGTFINPNHFACFLGVVLSLTLSWVLFGRIKPVTRIVLGYCCLVMGAGITLSGSRGAYLGLMAAGGVFLAAMLLFRGYRVLALVGLAGLLGAGAWIWARLPDLRFRVLRLADLMAGRDDESRLTMWRAAVEIWKEHPWWGVGPGHFQHYFLAYRSPYFQGNPVRAHNEYLDLVANLGLVGLGMVGVFLILTLHPVLVQFIASLRAGRDQNRSRTALIAPFAWLGSASFVLGHGMTDFNMYIPATAAMFTALLAWSGVGARRSSRFKIRPLSGKLLAGMLTLSAAVLLVSHTGRAQLERRSQRENQREGLVSEERKVLLQRLVEIEPRNDLNHAMLGDHHRAISLLGEEGWEEHGALALQAYRRSLELNRFRASSLARLGATLHWLNRSDEAATIFEQLLVLDPAGAESMAWQGWHLFQQERYAEALVWFERSLFFLPAERNPLAGNYVQFTRSRLNQ